MILIILNKTNPSKDSKASEGREEAVFVGEKYDLAKVKNISCLNSWMMS